MLKHHVTRLRYQFGKRLKLGENHFAVSGYFPNRLSVDHGRHEAHFLKPLATALRERDGGFWDIGANLGQTLMKVLSLDPGREYWGFEPQISCCFYLNSFLQKNRLSGCRVLPIALAESEGFLQLYSQGPTDEMASAIAGHQGRRGLGTTLVPTRRGDDVARELGIEKVGILKIDVEGVELSVLRGCEEIIRRHRPVIFFEVLPNFIGAERKFLPEETCLQNSARANDIHGFLTSNGFRISQIDNSGDLSEVSEFKLDDKEGFVSGDFVAWPN